LVVGSASAAGTSSIRKSIIEAWDRVKGNFTAEEIVDLTLLVSTINAWNRFGVGFRKSPV